MYLFIYVDDMLIAAKDMFVINKIKTQLSGEFETKDLRTIKRTTKKILGIKICRDREVKKLYLSQKKLL